MKLRQSRDFTLFGLADNIAKAFDINPVVVRTALVVSATFMPGITLGAYALAHVVTPYDTEVESTNV